MKIGMLIASFLPGVAYGGVASMAAEQAKELARRGHQVTVLTSNILDPIEPEYIKGPLKEFGDGGYEIIRFSSVLLARHFSGIFSAGMLQWLYQHAQEFDLFHVHYARGLIPLLPVGLLLRLRAKVYLQPHGMLDRTTGVRGWLDLLVTRRHLARARHVFALQPFEQNALKKIASTAHCSILPNGLPHLAGTPIWRAPVSEPRTVLFLGRLHPRKRVLTFVAAANILLSRRTDLTIRIVGPDGGDEQEARRQVIKLGMEKHVEFAGPVTRLAALEEFAGAAVYVLSTENENFSISVLEALMIGTPTVVTASTHNLDTLSAADAVEVSQPDPQSLACAIERLLDDPGLCARRSKNGRKLIDEQLNIRRVVDLLESHYMQAGPG
jgi:glycosyltransferase involved in cell wall biosynthesis